MGGEYEKSWRGKLIAGGFGGAPLEFFRLRLFWGGQNLNFDIFWAFQKNDILLGMKLLWIFFGVITKVCYI